MAMLYNVDSPINREQRNNLNSTFTDILRRFSNLQNQVNVISGNVPIEEVLNELTTAVENANNTVTQLQQMVTDDIARNDNATQVAVDNLNNTLTNQLQVIDTNLANIQTAINDSNTATTGANEAITNAQNAISEINTLITNIDYTGEYNPATTYNRNNIVRYVRDSYVSLVQQTGVTPSDDGVNWRLIAVGGLNGSGAVSTVNNIPPDTNGNITLNVATSQQLAALNQELDNHVGLRVSDNVHGLGSIASQDYEQGVFTPTIRFAGGNVNVSYMEQTGRFMRIAKKVFFDVYINTGVLTLDSASGVLLLEGLPYAPATQKVSLSGFVAPFNISPYTQVVPTVNTDRYVSSVEFQLLGSNQSLGSIGGPTLTTGTSLIINVSGSFVIN